MIRVLGAPDRIVTSAKQSWLGTGPIGCDVVRNGIVPPSTAQNIPSYDDPEQHVFKGWKAGVYGKDACVCESSLMDRHWTQVSVAYEPREIIAYEASPTSGEAVYCGLLFHHFGHFLLESTNRLWWPLSEDFGGLLVFQNTRPGRELPDFAARFFELIGVSDRVRVVETALSFENVIVPHRTLVIQKAIHQQFRIPFLKAGESAERQTRRPRSFRNDATGLYLSRTRFLKRHSFGERRIEREFAAEGYDILHMEELSLDQQILAIRQHSNIAGVAGSAFHNILFSCQAHNLTYICKDYNINLNFFMIDELMRNDSVYIYNLRESESAENLSHREVLNMYLDDANLNVFKIYKYLEEAGTLAPKRQAACLR